MVDVASLAGDKLTAFLLDDSLTDCGIAVITPQSNGVQLVAGSLYDTDNMHMVVSPASLDPRTRYIVSREKITDIRLKKDSIGSNSFVSVDYF